MSTILQPQRIRDGLKRRLERVTCNLGNQVECRLCGWTGAHFLSGGLRLIPGRKCPKCNSIERYRQLCAYLEEKTEFRSAPIRLLDLAPVPYFEAFYRRLPNIRATTADLMREDVDVQTDITRMVFDDDSFDMIFCFHVLEHVREDAAGMAELFRCLAPGGLALVQVPLREGETFEDPTADPARYEELFGQCDHVRHYGLDIQDRLRRAGFEVHVVSILDEFGPEKVRRLGLTGDDRYLFACRKPAESRC